jgi:hypothetical protein
LLPDVIIGEENHLVLNLLTHLHFQKVFKN